MKSPIFVTNVINFITRLYILRMSEVTNGSLILTVKNVNACINKRDENNLKYKLVDNEDAPTLQIVIEEKYHGITIDRNLEFDTDTNEKIITDNQIFRIIRKAFMYLNEKNFVPLYKTMVRYHLEMRNFRPNLRK